MGKEKVLEILKKAILLEKRGKVFYTKVADSRPAGAVKDFFKMMAKEEDEHERILGKQFKTVSEGNNFDPAAFDEQNASHVLSDILTKKITSEIEAADFEAAAISAAISMEEKSVKLYTQRAGESDDPAEINMYKWLAHWEEQHLEMLLQIDKELTEQVWTDNHFWPF